MPYRNLEDRRAASKRWYDTHKDVQIARAEAWKKAHGYRAPKKAREDNLPQFVAIDGEGIDKNDVHMYTYLGASTGDFIRDYNAGISTKNCFEFCLKQKKSGVTVVGFSLGYDCNMFFRDIVHESLAWLWEHNELIVQLDQTWYKLVYIPSKFLNISRLKNVHKEQEEVKYDIVKSVRVWDVFGFFQGSFVRSLEEWLKIELMHSDVLDTIKHMKEQRGQFTSELQADIERYCLEECRLLVMLCNKLAETLWRADIHLKSWHGAGAIAGYLLQEHRSQYALEWDDLPDAVREASLWGYFGGRVELFQQGPIPAPLYDYDVISAYPSAVVDLPNMQEGEWYGVDGSEMHVFNGLCQYGLWRVSWDTRTHPLSWLAPLPQRAHDGGIHWCQMGSGWYHTAEVQAALRVFGSCIHIERGMYFAPADRQHKPFAWVQQLFEQRLIYKRLGDARHIPLKLGLNSLYGKLAQGTQRNGKRPRWQNYYAAGYVTAQTRAKLLLAASNFYLDDVVCMATDGLFVRDTSAAINVSDELGGWELSQLEDDSVFFAQAGVYFTPNGKHVRTRGFSPRNMTYAALMSAWNACDDPFEQQRIQVTYIDRRFTGLGYAAGTGRWDEYRQWIARNRVLNLRTEPRKYHANTDDKELAEPFLLLPGEPPAQTRAYEPRQQNGEELQKYPNELLSYFDALDQPEYSDD